MQGILVKGKPALLDAAWEATYHAAFGFGRYARAKSRISGNPALSLATLYAPIIDDMHAVDAVIRARLHSDVVLIRQVAEYIIGAGGKRLRPALVLYSAGALGYRGTHHHELAAVVEFIHTATLLHDDVVDESDLRRGNKTANALFGNAASVLVGDFLYSRAFQMMVSVGSMRVQQVLADATNTIAEGEVLQLLNCHNADVDVAQYLQVIRYKTAKLFEAATRLGAILCGAPAEIEDGMARYGMHLGTAFQIIDDVLDYSGEEGATGKHLGDDLAEGKPTLPLIHVMKNGNSGQAHCVRRAIEEGGRDEFQQVLAAIHATGALDEARRFAEAEAQLALEAIAPVPHSTFRESLVQLASFAVARDF
jgi:octaprenyl-diphosphate synthase